MFTSSRIGLSDLANLCRRLSTGLESGVDIRRILDREAHGRSPRGVRNQLDEMSQCVSRGSSVYDAVRSTGQFFPPLFAELVQVGETTGHLDRVFRHLADHYENQVRLRRMFLSQITWPMVQLGAALTVVGLLIYVMSWLPKINGKPLDLLGFGLIGTAGLIEYVIYIALAAFGIGVLIQALRRGVFWVRPLQKLLLAVPVLGRTLQDLSLSRLAWSLELTFGSGMDLLKALPLSLQTMQNAYYSEHIAEINQSIRRGQEVHEALSSAGVFPNDFLDALEVGERSGRLPETMAKLSEQYRDRAERAMAALTQIAGFLVWAMVAAMIVFVIFRLASFYIGQIDEAARM
jgi:type IV pilus assembly protein PilC